MVNNKLIMLSNPNAMGLTRFATDAMVDLETWDGLLEGLAWPLPWLHRPSQVATQMIRMA